MWCGQGKQSGTGESWWWVGVWWCGQLSLHSSCLRRTPARVANPAVVGSQGVDCAWTPRLWRQRRPCPRLGLLHPTTCGWVAPRSQPGWWSATCNASRHRQAKRIPPRWRGLPPTTTSTMARRQTAGQQTTRRSRRRNRRRNHTVPSQRPRPRNPEALPQASAPAATFTVVEQRQKCAQAGGRCRYLKHQSRMSARLACMWPTGTGVAATSG